MEVCGGASALSSRTSISPSHFHSCHQPTSVILSSSSFLFFFFKVGMLNTMFLLVLQVLCQVRRFKVLCVNGSSQSLKVNCLELLIYAAFAFAFGFAYFE